MINFLLLAALSAIFGGVGWWSWKRPRRHINPLVGYRTRRSMKSQAAWNFAQVYSGKIMVYTAAGMLVLAVLLLPLDKWVAHIPALSIGLLMGPVVAASVLPLYLTERKLKQLFDEDGNPIK